MTWHEILAWVLVGAGAATIVALLLRKSRVEAPPARPPLPEIPGEAEQAKREGHQADLAEAAAQDPDPAATLGRLMGRK